jgi:peptidoglycan/LPS O-acetylase OafA/YrhL
VPSYLLYYQEIYHTFLGPYTPFCHSWSLGVEEKFYLLWPILAFVLLAGAARMRISTTAILAAVLLGLKPLAWFLGESRWMHHLDLLLGPYGVLLLGCLLALLLEDRRWFARLYGLASPAVTWLLLALVAALQLAYRPVADHVPGFHHLYALVAALFLGSLLLGRSRVHQALSARPLRAIGGLSYSMYLLHMLAIYAAQVICRTSEGQFIRSLLGYVLACFLTVVAAYVMAVLIEKPSIRLGKYFSNRILTNRRRVVNPIP